MTTKSETDPILHIGQTAGIVWQRLSENGPMSAAKVIKVVGEPRDAVMLALGWLAREDKLAIEEGRTRIISLKP
ncbi:MAG: winged helix-turn-helix domain-containing protein [Pirellulales bacterium]|nr:winged helix-turn-helix domain-containing protein [Pirellulales bacterium]